MLDCIYSQLLKCVLVLVVHVVFICPALRPPEAKVRTVRPTAKNCFISKQVGFVVAVFQQAEQYSSHR